MPVWLSVAPASPDGCSLVVSPRLAPPRAAGLSNGVDAGADTMAGNSCGAGTDTMAGNSCGAGTLGPLPCSCGLAAPAIAMAVCTAASVRRAAGRQVRLVLLEAHWCGEGLRSHLGGASMAASSRPRHRSALGEASATRRASVEENRVGSDIVGVGSGFAPVGAAWPPRVRPKPLPEAAELLLPDSAWPPGVRQHLLPEVAELPLPDSVSDASSVLQALPLWPGVAPSRHRSGKRSPAFTNGPKAWPPQAG
uniref:Uncharacterized protein n=1 Tax=Alexandrium monilatum TaxID=311494 RepID=A0A6T1IEF9_9DINO|mmetsp:Transcript_14082/g.45001  ORF Transcript_14082/g.45001 Transcript_14082/m.45001 type:complete len:251 (+) Transcript_14082:783-1535(+)